MSIFARSKFLTLAFLFAFATAAEARTWKSADGKYSIDAEVVRQNEKTVTLKKSNGQVITVPLAILSDADQAFLKSLIKPDNDVPAAGDEAAARETLEGVGLSVLSAGLQLSEEGELSDGLKEAARDRVELNKAAQLLATVHQQQQINRQRITQLTQLNVQLNARLTAINPNDIATNNKIVGALQSNEGQIQLLEQAAQKGVEQERAVRSAYNDAREKYVQQILNLRKKADAVTTQYAQLAANADVKQAVADLNAATGKSYEVAAGRSFLSAERRLKSLEDTVLSESIPLRRDRGDTFWVSVVVNGKHTKEMVLDSGASIVMFPSDLAKECGIEIGSQDRKIRLVLADGSQIDATEVTVPELRVGKFTVENVRCAVLGPEATEAEPLLGLSFLGEFRFELDTQKSTLTMVKVDEGGGSRTRD